MTSAALICHWCLHTKKSGSNAVPVGKFRTSRRQGWIKKNSPVQMRRTEVALPQTLYNLQDCLVSTSFAVDIVLPRQTDCVNGHCSKHNVVHGERLFNAPQRISRHRRNKGRRKKEHDDKQTTTNRFRDVPSLKHSGLNSRGRSIPRPSTLPNSASLHPRNPKRHKTKKLVRNTKRREGWIVLCGGTRG